MRVPVCYTTDGTSLGRCGASANLRRTRTEPRGEVSTEFTRLPRICDHLECWSLEKSNPDRVQDANRNSTVGGSTKTLVRSGKKPPVVDCQSKIPRCTDFGVTTSEELSTVPRQKRCQNLGTRAHYAVLAHPFRRATRFFVMTH